jgi:dTDP-4-dehydrorhamnose reductase
MKILVTGATGQLGSELKVLSELFSIRMVLDRKQVSLINLSY